MAALPTPTRTWNYWHEGVASSATRGIQSYNLLYTLKERFKSCGWTVWGSCYEKPPYYPDPSWVGRFSNGDGSDWWPAYGGYLPGSYDWLVLEHPTICGGISVLFSIREPSTWEETGGWVYATLRVYISKLGFGVANGGTDGDFQVYPTATDQVQLITWHRNSGYFWGCQYAANMVHYLHTMMSTDGTSFRMFIMHRNNVVGFFLFDMAEAFDVAWTEPGVCRVVGQSDGLYNVTELAYGNGGTIELDVHGLGNNYSFRSRHPNLALPAREMRLQVLCPSILGWPLGAGLAGAEEQKRVENNADGFPIQDVLLYCDQEGNRGFKGKLVDMWWGGRTLNGECFPGDTTRQFATFGDLVVPWDGTDPITCPMSSRAW